MDQERAERIAKSVSEQLGREVHPDDVRAVAAGDGRRVLLSPTSPITKAIRNELATEGLR